MNDPYYTNEYEDYGDHEEDIEEEEEGEMELSDDGGHASAVPNKQKFEELLNKYDEMIMTKAEALFPPEIPEESSEEYVSEDEGWANRFPLEPHLFLSWRSRAGRRIATHNRR